MPRTPSPINTAELNAILRRLYSRSQGGPRHLALCVLIVQSLMHRWRRSHRHHDKRLLRMVERLGEIEKHVEDLGGDVWGELERPGRGFFALALEALALLPLESKIPLHDSLVLRFQYSELWAYLKKHPFPVPPVRRNAALQKQEAAKSIGVWITSYWQACGKAFTECPCLCRYRRAKPTYRTLYGDDAYTTKQELFCRLLAHLHRSEPSAIAQDLKPSRRNALEQRM